MSSDDDSDSDDDDEDEDEDEDDSDDGVTEEHDQLDGSEIQEGEDPDRITIHE